MKIAGTKAKGEKVIKRLLSSLELDPGHIGHCLFSWLWDPCLSQCSEKSNTFRQLAQL